MNCYIFDIDGTCSNGDHRAHHLMKSPKDWDSYFNLCHLDTQHSHIIQLIKDLLVTSKIVYVTARGEERRVVTERWLDAQGISSSPLYMRKADDYRNDDIVKIEILEQIRKDGFNPIMAFDDRNRVVKAWREAGVPCAQVAEGDF